MPEKITAEIGVFDIPRSEEENYNQPIGLAICGGTEDIAGLLLLLPTTGITATYIRNY